MTDSGPARKRAPRTAVLDLDALLFAHAGPALVLDPTGCILAANDPAAQLLVGASGPTLVRRAFADFLAPDSLVRWQDWLKRIVTDRVDVRGLLDLINPAHDNGRPLDGCRVEFAGRPLRLARRAKTAAVHAVLRAVQPRASHPEEHPEYEHVLRGHVRRLEALNSVTTLVSQSLDPDEAVQAALRTTLAVMPADAGAVILTEPATGALVFKVQIGWRPVALAAEPLRLQAGLCHQVIRSNRPMTVGGLTPDARLSKSEFGDQAACALALAPMHARGKVLGVLSVMTFTLRQFTDDEVRLLCVLADQVGLAVENAQLYQAEQRQRRLAEALRQVALVLNSTLDLAAVLELIVEQLKSVVPYNSVSIVLKEDGRYRLVVTRGYNGDVTALVELDHGELPAIQEMLALRQPMLIPDTQLDPRWRTLHVPDPIRSWLGVPLLNKDKDQVLGILGIDYYQPQAYTAEDVRAAFIFADQAAVAIENARLYTEAQRRAAQLALINEVARDIIVSLNLTDRLDRATRAICRRFGYHMVGLLMVTPDGQSMVLESGAGGLAEMLGPNYQQPVGCGLIGRAAQTGEVILSNDVQADPRYFQPVEPERDLTRSELAVPLRRDDAIIGVLDAQHTHRRAFTADDVLAMQMLADQLVVAIANAQLYEEARQCVAELTALQEVNLKITASLDTPAVLDTIAQNTLALTQADDVHIFLYDAVADTLTFGAALWKDGSREPVTLHPREDGLTWQVVRRGQPVIVDNAEQDPLFTAKPACEWGLSIAGFPLKHAETVLGVFTVAFKQPHHFNVGETRLLMLLADQTAIAVGNVHLYEETKRRLDESRLLYELSLAGTSSLDFAEVSQRTVDALQRLMGFEYVALFLVNDEHEAAELYATSGQAAELERNSRIKIGQGLIGSAVSSGTLINAPDVFRDSRHLPGIAATRSELCVPLRVGKRVIGAIDLQSTRPAAFSTHDELLLTTVAGQWAVILDNTRLYAAERRRFDELTVLFEVARAGASTLNLDQVFSRMLDAIRRALRFEAFEFILYDPATGLLHPQAAYGFSADTVHADLKLGDGVVGWVAQSRQSALINDVTHDARYVAGQPGTQSELAVPLIASERFVGVMNVESLRANAFTADDEQLLSALASQLAMLIVNARLYEETQQRLAEVSTLYAFAEKLSSSLDLSELLDLIVTTLRRVLNCRGVSISLLMPETQTLEIRAAAGLQDQWRQSAKLKVGEGVSGKVAATATPLYVPDARSLPDFIFFDPVVRSLLVVPLTVKDRVIGTLAIDQATPDAFEKEDERLLVIAAAQAAVAIENAQLYAALKERADKLEKAYKELQELDNLKDELVQNVSHELRTPLTFIKGYVELILEQDLGPLNPPQRESLAIVAEKTNALTRLVSDIIFLQQIERESLELAPHSLRDVARMALQACEVAMANAGITLRLETPDGVPPIAIDRDRINQVFDNLLGNAIKFSPRGGTITIRIEDAGDDWQLSVADTGVGIPADKLRKVFDRFYQVDGSATRRFGGAGLGLAIARRIVESHGGKIWVESDGVPGHGSRFVFTLPKTLPPVERSRYGTALAVTELSES
jgi:GAF domain-containing protein